MVAADTLLPTEPKRSTPHSAVPVLRKLTHSIHVPAHCAFDSIDVIRHKPGVAAKESERTHAVRPYF